MLPTSFARLLAGVALLGLVAASAAEDKKDTPTKGQIKVGSHAYNMQAGKLYKIRVEGSGFKPNVTINPGFFIQSKTLDDGDTFEAYVLPRETKTHRVFVLPSLTDDLDGTPLDYTISCRSIPMGTRPLLRESSELKKDDPVYKDGTKSYGPHRAYKVTLKARQLYIIDLERDPKDRFDPMLLLVGPGDKIVSQDDDSGGNLNSRIIYQPRRTFEYKVIACGVGNSVGTYTLTVKGTDE